MGIQTKSNLILRDIDLLKQFVNCEAGITITTTDDDIRKEIEPYTSSVQDRMEALRKLKQENIKNYIFIWPIMPYLTNWKDIINQTKEYVDFYMLENLNIKGSIWNAVKLWLNKNHPELLKKYEEIYFTKNNYWEEVELEIRSFCLKNNIKCQIYFNHGK